MQIGRGQFEPPSEIQCDVQLQYYRYKDSIDADIQNADLVISHAGQYPLSVHVLLVRDLFVISTNNVNKVW